MIIVTPIYAERQNIFFTYLLTLFVDFITE